MTRVRQVGFGEAVNADMEGYSQLGFADPGALASSYPVRPVGQAWMQASRGAVLLHVKVADRAWSAPIQRLAAALAGARGEILVGVTCDRDPDQLAAETRYLEHAVAYGDVLLAGRRCLVARACALSRGARGRACGFNLRGSAWRRHRTGAAPPRSWTGA
jgi:hypothetical protein